MRPLKYTQQEIDFIHKLRRDGVRLNFIARYVYGVEVSTLSEVIRKRKKLNSTESRCAENKTGTIFTGDAE